jgi:hypothetical protein
MSAAGFSCCCCVTHTHTVKALEGKERKRGDSEKRIRKSGEQQSGDGSDGWWLPR